MRASDAPDATAALIAALASKRLTVAVSESLTGGLLVAELIRPTGASAVVLGGIVAYATELKASVLRVDAAELTSRGPVDPLIAMQMAVGVRQTLAVNGRPADIGISTTGVAGPNGHGGREPGTVFIGLSSASGESFLELSLGGSRDQIRRMAVSEAIAALIERFS